MTEIDIRLIILVIFQYPKTQLEAEMVYAQLKPAD